MEFIVSFKHPEKVIKEDELKHCRVWTMDFSEQSRTPIEDTPDITILPENIEIDINQQDKVNLFNNFKLNRPTVIPKALETPVPETESEPQTEPEPEPETQPQPEPEPETESETEPETQPEPEPDNEPKELSMECVETPKVEVSVEIDESSKDPIEKISLIIKEHIKQFDEKCDKLKNVRGMITNAIEIDADIQLAIDGLNKQIETQTKLKNVFLSKVSSLKF